MNMIKRTLFLLTFLLFFSTAILANIVEHDSFESILMYLNEDDHHRYTLIVIDIDNTIAEPIILAGSDQWVTHEITKGMQGGLTARQAWLAIQDLYIAIQHSIDLIPVEDKTPYIIKELQSRGVIVVILTARLPQISDRTIAQLKNIGIDLSHSPLWHEEIISDSDISYHYKNGIIFCDGNDKGIVLNAILQKINYQPKKVIAIDDKAKPLHSVKNIFDAAVDFIGIRYSKLDQKVAQFDPQRAQEEIKLIACAAERRW